MQKNRKWIFLCSSILVLVVGVGVFFYPVISNYQEKRLHENVIQGYDESVTSSDEQMMEKEWKKAEEYNKKLRKDYLDILNIEDKGVMGYIEIPKIEVRLPIYHGSSEESLKKGVGHIESTSVPIGGKGTHCVLTGHRGLPSAELFTRLDELKEKDLFFIHVLDQVLAYEVDQIMVVLPEEVDKIEETLDQDYVTLVTCTPYGVNTHRLLVRGKRTEYNFNKTESKQEESFIRENIIFIIGGGFAGIVLMIISCKIYLWKRRKRKRRRRKKK